MGFGEGVGLVALEEEEVVGSLFLSQVPAIGFGGVRRIRDDQDARQVHLRQMGRHGGFFVGVLGHGDLVDQALVGGLEVHQRQRLFRLGFLLVQRRVQGGGGGPQRRVLVQAGRRGVRVAHHLSVPMQYAQRLGIH